MEHRYLTLTLLLPVSAIDISKRCKTLSLFACTLSKKVETRRREHPYSCTSILRTERLGLLVELALKVLPIFLLFCSYS